MTWTSRSSRFTNGIETASMETGLRIIAWLLFAAMAVATAWWIIRAVW